MQDAILAFLTLVLGLVVGSLIESSRPKPTVVLDCQDHAEGASEMQRQLGNAAYPTLRYFPTKAQMLRVHYPATRTYQYVVQLRGASGQWVQRAVHLPPAADEASGRAVRVPALREAARNAARDLAELEGLNWKDNELTWDVSQAPPAYWSGR